MKILLTMLLICLFASCASYHNGHKKGIFLKNNAPMPVSEPTSSLIGLPTADDTKMSIVHLYALVDHMGRLMKSQGKET